MQKIERADDGHVALETKGRDFVKVEIGIERIIEILVDGIDKRQPIKHLGLDLQRCGMPEVVDISVGQIFAPRHVDRHVPGVVDADPVIYPPVDDILEPLLVFPDGLDLVVRRVGIDDHQLERLPKALPVMFSRNFSI